MVCPSVGPSSSRAQTYVNRDDLRTVSAVYRLRIRSTYVKVIKGLDEVRPRHEAPRDIEWHAWQVNVPNVFFFLDRDLVAGRLWLSFFVVVRRFRRCHLGEMAQQQPRAAGRVSRHGCSATESLTLPI